MMAGLASGFLALPAAAAPQDCEIAGTHVEPALPGALQGRSGLLRCRDHDNNDLVREQELQNGRFVGAVRYYARGRLSREQFLNERGNLNGRSREFGPAGQVLREASYENGVPIGLARSFQSDGRLQRATFYTADGEAAYAEFTRRGELRSLRCADRVLLAPAVDDATLCGFRGKPSQVAFLAENGTLRARATFVSGRRTRYETFQDNGLPATEEELVPAGRIERIFGADGVRRREVLWSLNDGQGVREREQEFAASGSLTRERRWSQGQLVSEQTFYLNGQARSKARYIGTGNGRRLETQDYYDNGALSAEGSYIDTGRYAPTPVGTHRQFDLQGRIKSESVYDNRGRLLRDDEPGDEPARRAAVR
ncbi:hypothetical protein GN316_09870 [Xylophilus sp. Kf1]|nr:hypothetical protein [Xylophilus sp. Kf1]